MPILEIINAKDSLMQNIIRIACLFWYIFDTNLKNQETILSSTHQHIKIRLTFHIISKTKKVTTSFYFISQTN